MPLQTIATQGTRMRIERAHATEYMSYPVGQIVGDMHEETTVREVVYAMLEEFIEATERLGNLLREE